MTFTFDIPGEIEASLQKRWDNLERHALEGFVIEAYRYGKISLDSVARMLGMEDRWDAVEFLSEKGVYPNYDIEDFKKDVETLERLRQKNAK